MTPTLSRFSLLCAASLAACTPLTHGDPDVTFEPIDDAELSQVQQGLSAVATYDATAKAPRCATVAGDCSSGTLLNGRANLGPEGNAPNTLGATCADGASGVYHSDESLDALTIRTLDGTNLAAGKAVRVDANVWAYSTTDVLDVFQSLDGSSTWSLVGSVAATRAGAQVLSVSFTLPAGGSTRAIRGQFRYGGSATSCAAGSYNDHDDLLFAVGSSSGTDAGIDAGAGPTDAGVGSQLTVVNPGFESGFTGWSATSGATLVSGGVTGSAVSLPATSTTVVTVSQSIQLPAPGTALVRVMYRNTSLPTPTYGGVTLNVVNLSGGPLASVGCGGVPSSGWTQLSCDASQLAGKLVSLQLASGPNPVLVDDVKVMVVPFAADAGVSLSPGVPSSDVLNGGFETATAWTLTGDAAFATGAARTGTGKATLTTGTSPMPGGVNGLNQVLPAAGAYEVSAWVLPSVAASNSGAYLRLIYANGSSAGCGIPVTTATWTRVSCSFGASTSAVTLRLEGYSSVTQTFSFDDVSIAPLTNGSFEPYGLLGWAKQGAFTSEVVSTVDGTYAAVLRPTWANPAAAAQTFTRTAAMNTLGLSYKWESACQSCNASRLTVTLSAPGFTPKESQLSGPTRVGWYSSGISLSSFPVGTPVTITIRGDSGLGPNGTERFLVDRVQLY